MSPPAIPEGPDGDGGWRANVQRAMLTLAAVVVPSIAIIAIVLRSGGWTWRDDAVMAALGILVPLCRFTRGPLAARAAAMLAIAFAAAFYALGRNGLAGGISAALLALTILAFLGTSRQLGFTFVAITAIAYLSVGSSRVTTACRSTSRPAIPICCATGSASAPPSRCWRCW
jgi:hypothetical protein